MNKFSKDEVVRKMIKMDHLLSEHEKLSPEIAHFCYFFNFGNINVQFGVVETHANPYISETLSYYLSFDTKFGSSFKKMRSREFLYTRET